VRFSPLPGPPGPGLVVAQPLAGRYRIEALLAVSGSAVLLEARDLRTGRDVVIKALRAEAVRPPPPGVEPSVWLTEEVRRARHHLQTERRLLVRLRNLGCHDVPHPDDYVFDTNPHSTLGETEPYLVLQRITGATLEALIAAEFPEGMDDATALDLIAPVVRVLELLHEPWRLANGRTWHCIYQDLKPANIMIDGTGRPVLIDFAGSQVVVDGVPVLEGVYTPGYAPLECLGPEGRVLLPCADVYTVGTTLHHMLSGRDPRARFWRTARADRPGEPPDPADLPKRVDPGLRRLVADCLAPRPSGRPADAGQLARRLAELGVP
jgi:serine/threonine protein kinase